MNYNKNHCVQKYENSDKVVKRSDLMFKGFYFLRVMDSIIGGSQDRTLKER